jgi:hypothetical protein
MAKRFLDKAGKSGDQKLKPLSGFTTRCRIKLLEANEHAFASQREEGGCTDCPATKFKQAVNWSWGLWLFLRQRTMSDFYLLFYRERIANSHCLGNFSTAHLPHSQAGL